MNLERLRDGLIVSCQAPPGSPLRAPAHMLAMARAAAAGGARAIRAEGPADVSMIARAVDLPVIGLRKLSQTGSDVYITPTVESAREIVEAGAAVVAVDATLRHRPDGSAPEAFIRRLGRELRAVPLLADVDAVEAGLRARDAGAAAIATTLAGYTGPAPAPVGPDLELVAALAQRLDCPVVAEGRYATPEQVRAAFAAGAFAVVVGTAITDPVALTRRFAAATPVAAPPGPRGAA
jgi:N-acylglucosamine-6-phosphate 2-epimerase